MSVSDTGSERGKPFTSLSCYHRTGLSALSWTISGVCEVCANPRGSWGLTESTLSTPSPKEQLFGVGPWNESQACERGGCERRV